MPECAIEAHASSDWESKLGCLGVVVSGDTRRGLRPPVVRVEAEARDLRGV